MLRSALVLFFLLGGASAQAADAPARQLAAELLAATGTAAVFSSAEVYAALADPGPFLGSTAAPRLERLLEDAGFRRWQPLRVWILQSRREGNVEHWENMAGRFGADALARGFGVLDTKPLPAAEEAISLLQPGKVHPGLSTLLKAYGADALLLVSDKGWALWARNSARQGVLPARTELFSGVVAETLAALQQWPEAGERSVVQVAGIASLADLAAARSVLQGLPGVRQVQVMRVARRQAWFAIATPDKNALGLALDGEVRLPAAVRDAPPEVPGRVIEAQDLACPLLLRQWRPEAASAQPPAGAAPVQSPSL